MKLGIKQWLVALALASALPVLAFAAIAAQRFTSAERQATILDLERRTEAAAILIDRYVQPVQDFAVTISDAPTLLSGDTRAFHHFLNGAMATGKRGRAVLHVDTTGRQLLNTRLPLGTQLPMFDQPRLLADTLQKKLPLFGTLTGSATGEQAITVTAPVLRGGQANSIIAMEIEPRDLSAILQELRLPEGWIGVVLDRQGTIIARAHEPEKWIGQSAAPAALAAHTQGPRGSYSVVLKDGISASAFYVALPNTGWIVSLGVPTRLLDAPAAATFRYMLALGLLSLSVASGLAFLVGRHMSRQVAGIAHAAVAVGEGRDAAPSSSNVRELDDVSGALAAAHRLIGAREQRLLAVVDTATDAIVVTDHGGAVESFNPAAEKIFGRSQSDAIGRHISLFIADQGRAGSGLDGPGESRPTGLTREVTCTRKDGTTFPAEVAIAHWSVAGERRTTRIIRDITARRQRDDHVRLIMRELSHRTKNALAVVQAMAWQTSHTTTDVQEFQERFSHRLSGLGRSIGLLVKSEWEGVDVCDVVFAQLAPFLDVADNRLVLDGPPTMLKPDSAQDIGLIMHELATNASKYGALSVPGGRVHVSWSIAPRGDGPPRFHMTWREEGGPPPIQPPPLRAGFGSALIKDMLPMTHKAKVRFDFEPTGVVWELQIDAARVIRDASA